MEINWCRFLVDIVMPINDLQNKYRRDSCTDVCFRYIYFVVCIFTY